MLRAASLCRCTSVCTLLAVVVSVVVVDTSVPQIQGDESQTSCRYIFGTREREGKSAEVGIGIKEIT